MEGFLTDTLPWLLVGLVAVAALLLLRQPIQYLARLCLRTLCSLAALAALSPLGPLIGVGLESTWPTPWSWGCWAYPDSDCS